MMRCPQVRERLQPLVDGALGRAEADAIRAHLHGCPACRLEFEALRALDTALSAEPMMHPPETMAVAIVSRAVARSRARGPALIPRWLEALTFAGVTAALAAIALMVVTVGRATPMLHLLGASPMTVAALIVCWGLAIFGSVYYGAQTQP